MDRRRIILLMVPTVVLGYAPSAPSIDFGRGSLSKWTHVGDTTGSMMGAPLVTSLPSRGLRRTMGRGCCTALRMSSLVEQAVTADEAIALINKAKSIVEGDMGVKVPNMLSEEFQFLWQFNGAMGRDEYLKEGKGPYTTLRTALPDLFWNSYDYRVDKYEKNRVWATTRLTGTHNGPLLFQGKEYPATGSRVEAAPECVSVVLDEESGLCTRMTGGFCLDRGTGNTGPAGGIWGVMQAIGEPVPAWKYFPLMKVLFDVVGPTFRPKKSSGVSAKLPFREPIAIALTKKVLSAARDDIDSLKDLLAEDAQIYAPILGPFKKKNYVESVSSFAGFFSGLDVEDNWYDARIDPFEPCRVWVTTRTTAKVVGPIECFGLKFEPKRQSYVGGPQTFSVTFDEDGFASKITSGCPMDPSTGDTDGLGNILGVLAGLGIPLPDFVGRPAPEAVRRFVDSITPEAIKRKPKPSLKATVAKEPASRAPLRATPATRSSPKTAPKSEQSSAKAPALPAKPLPKAPPTSPPRPSSNAAPKSASKAAPKPAPKAPSKTAAAKMTSKAVSKVVSGPSAKPAATAKGAPEPQKAVASSGSSSFGGMFRLGGGNGGKSGASPGVEKEKAPAKKEAPKKSPPGKGAAPSPSTPASKAKATAATAAAAAATVTATVSASKKNEGVEFSPQLTQKLTEKLGSPQRVDQLLKRTALYTRGAISATDYWGTLKTLLGPDGVQNLTPDIIGALPPGNQKTALFKIYSTG